MLELNVRYLNLCRKSRVRYFLNSYRNFQVHDASEELQFLSLHNVPSRLLAPCGMVDYST